MEFLNCNYDHHHKSHKFLSKVLHALIVFDNLIQRGSGLIQAAGQEVPDVQAGEDWLRGV